MVIEIRDLRKYSGLFVKNLQGFGERVRDSVLDGTVDISDDRILRAGNDLSARVPSV